MPGLRSPIGGNWALTYRAANVSHRDCGCRVLQEHAETIFSHCKPQPRSHGAKLLAKSSPDRSKLALRCCLCKTHAAAASQEARCRPAKHGERARKPNQIRSNGAMRALARWRDVQAGQRAWTASALAILGSACTASFRTSAA